MIFDFEEPPEERLFKAALGFSTDEREEFIRKSAGEDLDLAEAAMLLLQGYSQLGGDAAEATMSGGVENKTARQRWATSTEEPGTTIGAFTLVRKIGEGGMGTVWEAEQGGTMERRVALKVIKLGMDTAEVVKRFERERQTLAVMEHPNIAAVYEAGATELGRPYFAMEFVEGEPITDYCTKRNLSVDDRLRLVLTVCAGIGHAHRKGVIHRDLKPTNILVSDDGAPKIIDFGIAKAAADEGNTLFTRDAQMLGTPAYMSPEQASGVGAAIDTRSDVYALGVVLYELLAGAPPFDPDRLASTGIAELQKILAEEEPPTPSTKRLRNSELGTRSPNSEQTTTQNSELRIPQFEKDLDWIVLKAMAKEPERRYQTPAGLSRDLRRFLNGEVVEAVPPTVAYRLGKFTRRHRAAVAVGAVLLASVGLFAWSKIGAQLERQAENRALADSHRSRAVEAQEQGSPLIASLWHSAAAKAVSDQPAERRAHLQSAADATAATAIPVQAFHVEGFNVNRLTFAPSGRYVIVDGRDGEGILLDLKTSTKVKLGTHEHFDALVFSPDGTRIATVMTGSGDVELWDLSDARRLGQVTISERKKSKVRCMAFSADGKRLAVGLRRSVSIVNVQDTSLQSSGISYDFVDDVWRLGFSPWNPDLLAVSGERSELSLIRLDEATSSYTELLPAIRPDPPNHTVDFLVSPFFTRDQRLLVPNPPTDWRIFQIEPLTFVGDIRPNPRTIFDLSPDSSLILSGSPGKSQRVRINELRIDGRGGGEATFDGEVTSAVFSSDSTRVAAGDSLGVVRILSSPDAETTLRLSSFLSNASSSATALAFSPDDSHLMTAQYLGVDRDSSLVRLWKLPSGPEPLVPVEQMSLEFAVLNAATDVTSSGLAVPLPADAWWSAWQRFTESHPDFPPHVWRRTSASEASP